jgi:hypothetical protein
VRLIGKPILRLVSLAVVCTGGLDGGAIQVRANELQNVCLFLRVGAQVGVREARGGATNLTCLLVIGSVDVTFASTALLKALERAQV